MTSETLLLRQAHPNFMEGEKPTSQAFYPFPKDNGELSVYDASRIDAREFYTHYTQSLGLRSDSVWGVTKAETDRIGTTAEPDPLPDSPAHAKIVFGVKPPKELRKLAKQLQAHAISRGCLYRPV